MQKIQPFGTLLNYYVRGIRFLVNQHLEGQIMREFHLLQKMLLQYKRRCYSSFLLHSLGGERKFCQKSAEDLAEVVLVVEYWSTLPKNKQAVRGDPEQNKIYQVVLKNIKNPLVPFQLCFFKESSSQTRTLSTRIQTDKLMVPFLVSHREHMKKMCSKLILEDVMEDVQISRSLMKLDVTYNSIQKVTANLDFGLKSDVKNLKAAKS